jgi:hypothetical protein
VFKRLGGVSSRELIKEPGNANIQKRKDTHTMHKDNVIELKKLERFVDDPITEQLRKGARKLLAEALVNWALGSGHAQLLIIID